MIRSKRFMVCFDVTKERRIVMLHFYKMAHILLNKKYEAIWENSSNQAFT